MDRSSKQKGHVSSKKIFFKKKVNNHNISTRMLIHFVAKGNFCRTILGTLNQLYLSQQRPVISHKSAANAAGQRTREAWDQ